MNFRKTAILALCVITVILTGEVGAEAASLPSEVIPGGHTFGVKVFTEGVLVVGTATENLSDEAGLKIGDLITHVNGKPISTGIELQGLVKESGGRPLSLKIKRDGKNKSLKVDPQSTEQGWKIGAWVRDSMAGIGTLTFYDPNTGLFGALGHGINDIDTGKLMSISSGSIVPSTVYEVKMGQAGAPGELKGRFDTDIETGQLLTNTDFGIFGLLNDRQMLSKNAPMPVASTKEIVEGPAVIYSNVRGDRIEEFDIEIVKIYPNSSGPRNFMINVRDERLIGITGGIVQGMSGSPIIQNGKIVGAVTHVLINDPQRGYGIFINTMLEEAQKAAKKSEMPTAA